MNHDTEEKSRYLQHEAAQWLAGDVYGYQTTAEMLMRVAQDCETRDDRVLEKGQSEDQARNSNGAIAAHASPNRLKWQISQIARNYSRD